ncbi:hypothetical protein [Prescottella subtropica]|uniref:hypothetical protein n=1 Tax=Prescottella subtropica TaxID=2545757 RepID=UPI001387476D|nr:hypothetical protein [Prescottella subtropica]
MCKAKPGRRCPRCRAAALTAQRNTVRRLHSKVQALTPGTAEHTQATHERDLAAREMIMRQADLDSTEEARVNLAADIEARLAADPRDKEIPGLSKRLIEGRLMEAYRRDQIAAMPPKPTHPAALDAYKELGDARYDMARCRLRMDMNSGDQREWEHWARRHYEAAENANIAASRMHVIEQSGDPKAWADLTDAERHQMRVQTAADGTFSTPAAPRALDDVLHDYADRQDGFVPIPDALAHAAHPPYTPAGSTAAAAATPAAPDAATATATDNDTTEGTGPASTPTPAGATRSQAAAQKKRRSERRRSARQLLASIRSTANKLNPDRLASKTGLNTSAGSAPHGDSLDCTGMLLLMELLPTK